MIIYRQATFEDYIPIARLHTANWQIHYRVTMRQDYLDHELATYHLKLWHDRLQSPTLNQYVVVALDGEDLIGFACSFANHQNQGQTLLDNLHVASVYQGNGIGRHLAKLSAEWSLKTVPQDPFYLQVLLKNEKAIQFYVNLGGNSSDPYPYKQVDGTMADVLDMTWPDPNVLI